MSFADSPSLELERQPRSEYAVALVALAIASIIPWLLPFTAGASGVFTMFAATLVASCSWWAGLIGERRRIVRAIWESDGSWWLIDTKGIRWAAVLAAETRVLPSMIWLHWRSIRGTRQMLLRRRGMPEVTGRRLAARLRLENAPAGKFDGSKESSAAGRSP